MRYKYIPCMRITAKLNQINLQERWKYSMHSSNMNSTVNDVFKSNVQVQTISVA